MFKNIVGGKSVATAASTPFIQLLFYHRIMGYSLHFSVTFTDNQTFYLSWIKNLYDIDDFYDLFVRFP